MTNLKSTALFVAALLVGVTLTAFVRWPPSKSSDWAAWVQAVASVAAIWWAGYSGRKLQTEIERRTRKQAALALVEIAETAWSISAYVQRTLPDRAAVVAVGEGNLRFEIGDVREIERVLQELPLHDLMTPEFVKRILVLRSTYRQLRENLEAAIERFRTMDAEHFDKLFEAIHEAGRLCEESLVRIRETENAI